jgi:hypothetical protein
MSTRKIFRVVVIEWLSHKAFIEAASAEDAERVARDLWSANAEHELFRFEDSGIDGVTVEEIAKGGDA